MCQPTDTRTLSFCGSLERPLLATLTVLYDSAPIHVTKTAVLASFAQGLPCLLL
jgi:hypothetical protein